MQPYTQQALRWIVAILQWRKIPFQITGGLAAKMYGSTRPLNDIDIEVPDDCLQILVDEVKPYITYGPAHFRDGRWDCLLITLNYNGQLIDIGGADSLSICDARTGIWKFCPADLSSALIKPVFGMNIPVVHPQNLIDYKAMLQGKWQQEDIKSVKRYLLKTGS